jgi:Rrf2 family iron-sulfur cluster assembly transcriptional regulator
MRLSTKGRYAVTAMLDLAIHHDEGAVTLAEISAAQGISLSYLEQLFARLRKNGLVRGIRGPGGGYCLSRAPAEISVADIIDAIGEGIDVTLCSGSENCQEGERCLTHELWSQLGVKIFEFLDSVSLAGFLERKQVSAIVDRQLNRVTLNDRRPRETVA